MATTATTTTCEIVDVTLVLGCDSGKRVLLFPVTRNMQYAVPRVPDIS